VRSIKEYYRVIYGFINTVNNSLRCLPWRCLFRAVEFSKFRDISGMKGKVESRQNKRIVSRRLKLMRCMGRERDRIMVASRACVLGNNKGQGGQLGKLFKYRRRP
jgi:hypothetical protein